MHSQGLCYNHQRGLFVIDGPGTAPATPPIVANLGATDRENDRFGFPTRVQTADLLPHELGDHVEIVHSRALIVGAPLWPFHLTHMLLNFMVPLENFMLNVEVRLRDQPALRELWTTHTQQWLQAALGAAPGPDGHVPTDQCRGRGPMARAILCSVRPQRWRR